MSLKSLAGQRLNLLIRFSLYFIILFVLCAFFWVESKFGIPDLDQLLYHLAHLQGMAVSAGQKLVRDFTEKVILVPLFVSSLIVILESFLSNRLLAESRLSTSLLLRLWQRRIAILVVAVAFFISGEVVAIYRLSHSSAVDYFDGNYVPFDDSLVYSEDPKNLVLIYLESIEWTYSDQALFERDLIRKMNAIPGIGFSRFEQVPGTGWTVAGIVASQCGVPLKNVFFLGKDTDEGSEFRSMNRIGGSLTRFLPGAMCLSDILALNGYRNVFIGGASHRFAGKGAYLRNHSYDEIYGREELLELGIDAEQNEWGFSDDVVFKFAKDKLAQLHSAGNRFNLTLLTIDTHGPEGVFSPTCRAFGAKSFDGLVECVSEQVAEFIQFMADNNYLSDTRVVLLGDHLVMRNPLSNQLERAAQRTIYNRFIGDSVPLVKNREQVVHFDMLPTILEFVGYRVEGGRLALGYSGFGELVPPPPAARIEELRTALPRRSEVYNALWR